MPSADQTISLCIIPLTSKFDPLIVRARSGLPATAVGGSIELANGPGGPDPGCGIDMAIEHKSSTRVRMPKSGSSGNNPLIGGFKTSDGGTIVFNMVTPGPYIRDSFEHIGLGDYLDDPRFSTAEALMQNCGAASALIRDAFATKPFEYAPHNRGDGTR